MRIRKAYRFRVKTTESIEQTLSLYAGHCRFVWNKCLDLNLSRLRAGHRILRYGELDFWSKQWKASEEYGFLKEIPAHLIQQKLRDLDRAFSDAFDKTQPGKKLPRFKKRGQQDSFRFPEPKQIRLAHRRIQLPKLGWLGFHQSQPVMGDIRNVTISRQGGHWMISIQVEQDLSPQSPTGSAVGIDLGIVKFATLSTGEHIESPKCFRRWEKRLGREQRRLSRKQKFSGRWKKQAGRIQKIHEKIREVRGDFLHKVTASISKNHAIVAVEDLQVKNMSRSASGDLENPGRQVSAKSGLNKAILDQGWSEFRRQLDYKLTWRGGMLIQVDPRYTSQQCSGCQHTAKESRRTQSEYNCVCCGLLMNADVNAAQNILAAGHAVMARGASALSAA